MNELKPTDVSALSTESSGKFQNSQSASCAEREREFTEIHQRKFRGQLTAQGPGADFRSVLDWSETGDMNLTSGYEKQSTEY